MKRLLAAYPKWLADLKDEPKLSEQAVALLATKLDSIPVDLREAVVERYSDLYRFLHAADLMATARLIAGEEFVYTGKPLWDVSRLPPYEAAQAARRHEEQEQVARDRYIHERLAGGPRSNPEAEELRERVAGLEEENALYKTRWEILKRDAREDIEREEGAPIRAKIRR